MVKQDKPGKFIYRDAVWRGSDMLGTGVASFSHMSGIHFQNAASWNDYLDSLAKNQLPLDRAFPTAPEERLTREMILQLKLGKIETSHFREKFDADILEVFGSTYQKLQDEGRLTFDEDAVTLTPKGLLRVDGLLPAFYAPKYQNARYT